MPAAEIKLSSMFTNENVTGVVTSEAKKITFDIAKAVDHIHTRGITHGDTQPLNLTRMNSSMILIDIDASASIGVDFVGAKYSYEYCPPEFFVVDNSSMISIRSPVAVEEPKGHADTLFEPVIARGSFDSWSLGVVLFELFTGRRLLEIDNRGNADDITLHVNHNFSELFKRQKLNQIADIIARNLVSTLLNRDPTKRPTMESLLNHYFFQEAKAECQKSKTEI